MPVLPGLKSYKFDVGNSTKGSLGMVIRVWAPNKKRAVEIANAALSETEHLEGYSHRMRPIEGVEYLTVYLAGNLTVRHIDSQETENVEA
jgi:hypothetical protein